MHKILFLLLPCAVLCGCGLAADKEPKEVMEFFQDREDLNAKAVREAIARGEKPLTGSSAHDVFDFFPLNENGSFEIPTLEKVCSARKELDKIILGASPPRQMIGEVLVEGVLTEAHSIQGQKQALTVKVTNVPFGKLKEPSKKLTVVTPLERVGGVPVAIGEMYTMLLLPLNGKYYSWAAAGSAPKDPAYGGFYKCPEE